MNTITLLTLNNRLASASKKFSRACEQIKLLKQQLAVYITMFATYNEQPTPVVHNVSREMCRQKIETLQNFKHVFFKYAHQKADEITKIQCELYGDEAVQEAYENTGNEEVVVPSSSNNDETNQDEESIEEHSTSYWAAGNNNNNNNINNNEYESSTQGISFTQQNETNSSPVQLQLIEYDFITA